MSEPLRTTTTPTTVEKKKRSVFSSGPFYTLVRRVHLYAGLVLLTFTTMYFGTGTVFIHSGWFGEDPAPKNSRSEFTLDADIDPSSPAFAAKLQGQLGIRGQRSKVEHKGEDRWRIKYWQPGLSYTVDIDSDRRVRVHRQQLGFRETLAGFHQAHGYGGGWLFDIWAWMLDLISISLVLFAVSGIFMWWKSTKNRTFGWLLLATSYGYAAAIFLYLIAS